MRALGTAATTDTQLASLIALARLGDPRGRPALTRFAAPTATAGCAPSPSGASAA
jgi:hypothetical protein